MILTLVVVIMRELSPPIMIADILLSQRGVVQSNVPYPSQPNGPVTSKHTIVGLVQKIVKITDGLMLGYAGNIGVAEGLVEFLIREYLSCKNIHGVFEAFKDAYTANQESYIDFQAVLVGFLPDRTHKTAVYNCRPFDNEHLGTVIALGSGAEQFKTYVSNTPPATQTNVNTPSVPPDAERISYVLHYVTSTLKRQAATGHGVAKAWGGGFEIAMIKNDRHLEKLDNIFTHAYAFSATNGKVRDIRNIQRKMFQCYVEDDLVIVTQAGNGKPDHFLIQPLKAERKFGYLSFMERPAQLIHLYFIDRDTDKEYFHTEYREVGNPNFCLRHREGVGAFVDVRMS